MTFPVPLTGWYFSEIGPISGKVPLVIIEKILELTGIVVVNPYISGGEFLQPAMPSAGPSLGETWQVEALFYTIGLQWKATAYVNIAEAYKKLTEQLTLDGQRKVALEVTIVEIEKQQELARANEKRFGEILAEGGKSARENTEAAVGVSNEGAKVHAANVEKVNAEKELKQIATEEAATTLEREKLGEPETFEAIQNSIVGVAANISTPTAPLSTLSLTPLTRTITKETFAHSTIEGVNVAERTATITEYYIGRADLQNPATVRPQQQITGSVQIVVPRKTVTIAAAPGIPFVENLNVAIAQYVIQCSQVATFAKEGNP